MGTYMARSRRWCLHLDHGLNPTNLLKVDERANLVVSQYMLVLTNSSNAHVSEAHAHTPTSL